MHFLTSIAQLTLAVFAFAAFHLAAAFFVLVYAAIAVSVGLARWCRDVSGRARRRPLRPRVASVTPSALRP